MLSSPEIKDLASALSRFQGEVDTVKQESVNPFFHSKYASLADIIKTIRPVLSKHGLSVCQTLEPSSDQAVVNTVLMHITGQWIQSTIALSPKDLSPQGIGSAITYARRYAFSAILGIATDDDDDGNTASVGSAGKQGTPVKPLPPIAKSTTTTTTPMIQDEPKEDVQVSPEEVSPVEVLKNLIANATKDDVKSKIYIINAISKLSKTGEASAPELAELRKLSNDKFLS